MFDFSKRTEGRVTVLALKGQLDALTAGKIKPFLDELIETNNIRVVYDLSELSLIDSSGIGVIVSTFKRTRAIGGDTVVARITEQPKMVFDVLSLHKYIKTFDSIELAIRHFS